MDHGFRGRQEIPREPEDVCFRHSAPPRLERGAESVDRIGQQQPLALAPHIRKMKLPQIQPIIPSARKEPFDDPDWLFELKYDGFRGLCYLEHGRNRFISRNGNTLSRFDALGEKMAGVLGVSDAILDGEVIVSDETGRPQFYDLLRRTGVPAYVAFDILWLNGTDLRALPLSERRRRLQTILPAGSPAIAEPLSVVGRGSELFELMCAHDLEGIVAKRLRDPYEPRVRWLKIKNRDYSQAEGRGDLLNGSRRRLRIRRG
jgi:bifunctional non-homologous end joining protein LigD